MQNFIEQKTKFDQKRKISNARINLNEIWKITFLFEAPFKEKRQSYDHSFCKQLNLKTGTLQRIYVNKHRYITSIVQKHRHKIDQLNNCADRRDVYKKIIKILKNDLKSDEKKKKM